MLVALTACKDAAPPPPPPPAPEAIRALAPIVASCASASGDVQVRRPGQPGWEPVAEGSVFRVGDEVKTGPLSTARVEFLAGGGLEMEEQATVVIDVAPPSRPAPPGEAAAGESRVAVKEYGFARRLFCEEEAPRDLLVGPRDGSVVAFSDAPPQVTFSWEDDPSYGTRSAAVLRLAATLAASEIHVADGRPCTTPFEDRSRLLAALAGSP